MSHTFTLLLCFIFFFFNDTATTEIYTLSLHDALPIFATGSSAAMKKLAGDKAKLVDLGGRTVIPGLTDGHIHGIRADRKSTRLNSSHQIISYAVFCLKKKKKNVMNTQHYALKSTMRLH